MGPKPKHSKSNVLQVARPLRKRVNTNSREESSCAQLINPGTDGQFADDEHSEPENARRGRQKTGKSESQDSITLQTVKEDHKVDIGMFVCIVSSWHVLYLNKLNIDAEVNYERLFH